MPTRLIRMMIVALAILMTPYVALGQDGNFRPGAPVTDTNPYPSKCVVWNGSAYVACSGGGGGGGSTPTGTAGSPNTNVVTVQGITNGTPQNVTVTNQIATGAAGTPASPTLSVQGQTNGVPLPATITNQIATGAAGTPAAATLSVQGQTNGVPIPALVTNATIANTISDGADVATGATGAAAYAGTGSCSVVGCLKGIYAGLYAATPTGTNVIGRVLPALDNSSSGAAIVNVTTSLASGLVLKSSGGNLHGLNVVSTNTAGYVMIFNSASVPADGAVTPTKCYVLPASSSLDIIRPVPIAFGTGISVAFSTTGCFNKTASATAYISGDIR